MTVEEKIMMIMSERNLHGLAVLVEDDVPTLITRDDDTPRDLGNLVALVFLTAQRAVYEKSGAAGAEEFNKAIEAFVEAFVEALKEKQDNDGKSGNDIGRIAEVMEGKETPG